MNWADVAVKALEFLQKPNALGLVILMLCFAVLVYVLPIAMMTLVAYDNTTRLEKAITNALQESCRDRVALKVLK